jgi:phosphatidylglycerophosphate synthase
MAESKPDYAPERRPIAARHRAASRWIAVWLVRRDVSANAISLAGMGAGVAAGACFALTADPLWRVPGFLGAAACMQLRLLANMFDGMVALESRTASPVGELYNEVPDRVSDAAMFIGAGYGAGGSPELGYVAALCAIFVAYIRAQGKAAGAPYDFGGPLAKPQRVFVLTVSAVFCALWSIAVPARLYELRLGELNCGVLSGALLLSIAGMAWTAVRRLRRIALNLRENSAG